MGSKRVVYLIIGIIVAVLLFRFAFSIKNASEVFVIDANEYSEISAEELVNKMGEPSMKEEWTSKTSKGNFKFITYAYENDKFYCEFIVCDDKVVRMNVYSHATWYGKGELFEYSFKNKNDILMQYGIDAEDSAVLLVDNGFTWKLSQVSEKISIFDVQTINSKDKTYGFVKITYNSNYFD